MTRQSINLNDEMVTQIASELNWRWYRARHEVFPLPDSTGLIGHISCFIWWMSWSRW